jgi:hypothetical protein
VTIIVLLVLFSLYGAPAVIAGLRGHRQFGPILVINLLLGWTVVGWAVALAMAVSHQATDR